MTNNLVTRYIVVAIVMGLAALCIGLNWPIDLGIDLRGGTILTYRVEKIETGVKEDRELTATGTPIEKSDLEDTITVISDRINQSGLSDIQVRQEGDDIIAIYLEDFTREEADEIRERMTQVGQLLFPIVAEQNDVGFEGDSFNKAQFEQQRKAALTTGEPFFPPPGFRWYPTRPERKDKMSDEVYQEKVARYESNKLSAPHLVDGEWMYFDPEFWNADLSGGFNGDSIKNPIKTVDEVGGRAVAYSVREQNQNDFAAYTHRFTDRKIALVLNKEIWSTATIQGTLSDSVLINKGGGGYTEAEQDWLMNALQAGSLKLQPKLLSTDEIGATLGKQAIDRGVMAFMLGLVLVIAMMLFWYRFSGILAVVALVANFVMIFGILMLLDASLTLPGIAGLVLTVGMAVDANILIFERIREEISKGKTVVHGAKNGFDRAFVTIFDANLTTFIVAVFLVVYGQGPIKGFGYTLMAGIVCTMFASLYITRTLMGFAIKSGMLKEINYRSVFDNSKISFPKYFKKAAILSILVIALGMVAFVATGRSKYGLDFNGGTSVRMQFAEATLEKDIRDAIDRIQVDGKKRYDAVEVTMLDPTDGKSEVVKVNLDYHPPAEGADSTGDVRDEYEIIRSELDQVLGDRLIADGLEGITYSPESGVWSATLNFTTPVTNEDRVRELARAANLPSPRIERVGSDDKSWQVSANVPADVQGTIPAKLLAAVRKTEELSLSNPFPEVRFVGPRVVSDLKSSAIQAILVSLFFILAYIWFRFKELKYGVAAAVALVHDVLVALGITVAANASGIIHVPITLDVIAAFLTIIGYSLNDTIVVFDRIRENLGNVRGTFGEVVNRSINQTLSRTVLTSVTTAVVVAAVFFFNIGIESPLESFAFTLLIGIIVGTYSSMFVASPILIWMHLRDEKKEATAKLGKAAAAS